MEPLQSLFSLKKNSHNPLLFHSGLWCISFVLLLFLFAKGTPVQIDYFYTLGFIISLFIPVLFIFYILIPKFLKTERYLLFFFCFIATISLFAWVNTLFLHDVINFVFPDYFFISYVKPYEVYIVFFLFISLVTLVKLAEDWVHYNALENLSLQQQNELIASKLQALRGQINPHFLFNALNVIYALALENKPQTTSAIVQLSDILRYVIYDSDTQKVSVFKEKTLIDNYLNFQKHRHHTPVTVSFECDLPSDFSIYPMLLLPLVENSFKHGAQEASETGFIHINMSVKTNIFVFSIVNNRSEKQSIAAPTSESSGLGLQNIKQNLAIIYPEQHEFIVEETKDQFAVTLKIHQS